ncbi:Lcl domain-containing protein [Cupriavidus nantongensis]
MNAVTATEAIAVQTTISQTDAVALKAGDAIGGGFYAGQIRQDDGNYVLVVAPKDGGDHDDIAWNADRKRVDGALSYYDGRANTVAMAQAGSELAVWALGLQLNGIDDWYLPARDELELAYRNLKPTTGNYAGFRDGENISAVPTTYAYTEDNPSQTAAEAFQEGGAEAFEQAWYWASTQYAGYSGYAWLQTFDVGDQGNGLKDTEFRARAVRRLKIQ